MIAAPSSPQFEWRRGDMCNGSTISSVLVPLHSLRHCVFASQYPFPSLSPCSSLAPDGINRGQTSSRSSLVLVLVASRGLLDIGQRERYWAERKERHAPAVSLCPFILPSALDERLRPSGAVTAMVDMAPTSNGRVEGVVSACAFSSPICR